MNEKRRKCLRDALEHLETASGIVMDASLGEQMAYDNLPEEFQWSERGERMEAVASDLEEAGSLINEAIQIITSTL